MAIDSLHYLDSAWLAGNPPLLGPLTHATWMASVVFDGARAFEGVAPDLDLHCQRVVDSARNLGLDPPLTAGEMTEIAWDGICRFPAGSELYIRPLLWAERGAQANFVQADAASTRFCLSLWLAPLPAVKGSSVCLSDQRRPLPVMAPTNAKAACLYPNSGRAVAAAQARGFDNAVLLDGEGKVAELATANLWIAKDGAAHTPADNGSFLAGITRRRVALLLRAQGVTVHERSLTWQEVLEADELFSTGNYAKVMPITRVEERDLQPGPLFKLAREAYWAWAHREGLPPPV